MQGFEHEVLIIGAGPTGLMLAGELALAGVDVGIVERRLDQAVEGLRATGLHTRSIELLDQRGIADRFVSEGKKHFAVPFPGVILDARDRPSRHNYTLALSQGRIEQHLADWVAELAVPIHRGHQLKDAREDIDGVAATLEDGRTLRARYLVGCDGGRSLVRKTAGIGFPGWEPSISYLIFEAELTEEPPPGIRHGERGLYAIGPAGDGKRVRGVVTEPHLMSGDRPGEDQLRAALVAGYGSDLGIHDVSWLSRFTDAARQADAYRKGRILLAGDAAHVHSPAGGQGLATGLDDAVNLGWKLAQVVKGVSSDSLLDTYDLERRPVTTAVLRNTLALTALNRGDERTNCLREMLAGPMQMDGPRRWYVALMSGLDVRYDLGDGHPLLGRRMPDLDIVTAGGERTIFGLMHDARPVLLDFNEAETLDITPRSDRVRSVRATTNGPWDIPVLGRVTAPAAVLIRPDGYVAWAGDGTRAGLHEALARWCGAPAGLAAG